MKILLKLVFASYAILTLAGCSSTNVKSYKPDPTIAHVIQKNIASKVRVSEIKMPKGNSNKIMCRMAGNIYLPNKETFSQYIQKALEKNLFIADRLADSDSSAQTLNVEITRIGFASFRGKWFIDANVSIDNHPHVVINNVTEFGSAWDAFSACRNVTEAFEDAVDNLVVKILEDPQVLASLQQAKIKA